MRVKKNMQLIYAKEAIPDRITKSIFLAGPVPRVDKDLEWRTEALLILKGLGFDGTVFLPISRNKEEEFDESTYQDQIEWELACCKAADLIVFWIPRLFREDFEMIGLTTNVEFGMYFKSERALVGSPDSAKSCQYLKYLAASSNKPWYSDLYSLLKETVNRLKVPIPRLGVECLIPRHIFQSVQFQNWYIGQRNAGNSLTGFELLYEFYIPKLKKLFLTVFKPDVYITEENRIKSNEFVVARTDMSYICAYYRVDNNPLNSCIVLVKEFRSPVRNKSGFVFELPGGSSFNDSDDPRQVASHELEEETGLKISKERMNYLGSNQSCATLASHLIHLYSVELTETEFIEIKQEEMNNSIHGIEEDSERTFVKVGTIRDILSGQFEVDLTNLGMIFQAITY